MDENPEIALPVNAQVIYFRPVYFFDGNHGGCRFEICLSSSSPPSFRLLAIPFRHATVTQTFLLKLSLIHI